MSFSNLLYVLDRKVEKIICSLMVRREGEEGGGVSAHSVGTRGSPPRLYNANPNNNTNPTDNDTKTNSNPHPNPTLSGLH